MMPLDCIMPGEALADRRTLYPDRLGELAAAIRQEHEAVMAMAETALEHGRNAGVLLLEAKEKVPYGEWLSWLAEYVTIPERTAQAYMRVATRWGEIEEAQRVADLSLRGALNLLTEPKTNVLLSETTEWYTPTVYVEAARRVMGGIDLDPASCAQANEVVGAGRFYSLSENGLRHPWCGRVWLNPPYGREAPVFVAHLLEQVMAGNVEQAVALLSANAISAGWFKPLWEYTLCFADHRIQFWSPSGQSNASTIGNVFVYIGDNCRSFAREFGRFGYIVRALQAEDFPEREE